MFDGSFIAYKFWFHANIIISWDTYIYEKIIKLRKEKGLSQEEFGNAINVSRQAISKWESEQTKPDIDKLKEIAKFFDVSYDYLLNDEIDNIEKDEESIRVILKNGEIWMLEKLREKFTYTQTIVLSFALLTLIGATLLTLPISSQSGEMTPVLNTIFTSTSAISGAGLVLYDTYTHWSLFGRIVILLLIQMLSGCHQ